LRGSKVHAALACGEKEHRWHVVAHTDVSAAAFFGRLAHQRGEPPSVRRCAVTEEHASSARDVRMDRQRRAPSIKIELLQCGFDLGIGATQGEANAPVCQILPNLHQQFGSGQIDAKHLGRIHDDATDLAWRFLDQLFDAVAEATAIDEYQRCAEAIDQQARHAAGGRAQRQVGIVTGCVFSKHSIVREG